MGAFESCGGKNRNEGDDGGDKKKNMTEAPDDLMIPSFFDEVHYFTSSIDFVKIYPRACQVPESVVGLVSGGQVDGQICHVCLHCLFNFSQAYYFDKVSGGPMFEWRAAKVLWVSSDKWRVRLEFNVRHPVPLVSKCAGVFHILLFAF
jgi:hypothetical protein